MNRRGVVVGLVVVLLAGACGSPTPTPNPSSLPSGPDASSSASSGPTTGPSGQTDEAWGALTLPPIAAQASLEPTKAGAAGVALDTAFRLKSLDGTPAATLASRLTVTPAVAFAAAAPDGDSVTLQPTAPLTPGLTYRLALARPDGTIAGSWAIAAAHPLNVTGTLPDEQATDVPLDTSLEVTFDQVGVTADAFQAAFTVTPAVTGKVEVHGRTLAFAPAQPLRAGTVYTMTVRHGLALPGTGQVLAADVVRQFETASSANAHTSAVTFGRKVYDVGTTQTPAIGLVITDWSPDGRDPTIPSRLDITVHRLGGMSAAMTAYDQLRLDADWSHSGGAPVATGGLPLVLKATVAFHPWESGSPEGWIGLPRPLAAGWYVLTTDFDGYARQVVIQSTDVATYAAVSTTRSVVWVNDVRTGHALSGAALRLDGAAIGSTGSDGLRVATTPASVTGRGQLGGTSGALFLTVRDATGRSMFVPVDAPNLCGKCDVGVSYDPDTADGWWHVIAMDRTLFRSTDHANAWGIVRRRDGGALPKHLEVRLVATDATADASPPIVTATPTLTPAGAFAADLPFRDLPTGYYLVQVWADGSVIEEEGFAVGPIVKPAYTLSVVTDRHAIQVGERVTASTSAAFFDGSPTAGVDLQVGFMTRDSEDWKPASTTTSTGGSATTTTLATASMLGNDQWDWLPVSAYPTLPEEADIGGGAEVAVFASSALLTASSTIAGKQLTIGGSVNDVAFSRFEGAVGPADTSVDPTGAPRARARVSVHVDEITSTQVQTGTSYDFISKRVVPVFEEVDHTRSLGDHAVITAADGRYRLVLTVAGRSRHYVITAHYLDHGSRSIQAVATADQGRSVQPDRPILAVPGVSENATIQYGVGDAVRVTMRGGHVAANDRYLFTVDHRGLQVARAQASATFSTPFGAADVPNLSIDAVRFTGTGYEPVAYPFDAFFRTSDRHLAVAVTSDAAHYQPGGHVDLTVKVADPAGHPVAASVVVKVIDEKLYATAAAVDVDPLADLYLPVGSGRLYAAWSHQVPVQGGEGGDTGGGGDARDDFRDWLVFKLVTTGSDGVARIGFDLSDDLTSWRATAGAVDTSLRAGAGMVRLPVGLPFFADATLGAEYLTSDHPILRVRAFGTALGSTTPVTFKVSSADLGLAATTLTATGTSSASLSLPTLTAGQHQVRIEASMGSGASALSDTLIRSVSVVDARATQRRTMFAPLTADLSVSGGATGFTSVVLSDAGRGRVLPVLFSLSDPGTARADSVLAAALARRVLAGSFGRTDDDSTPLAADVASFQTPDGGIALFPYSIQDLELSALAALAADPRIDRGQLGADLQQALDAATTNGERLSRIQALTGLAALGQPVGDDIRALAGAADLQPVEVAWLAVGAAAVGDLATATTLERGLLGSKGQRLGPWARLDLGDRETDITTTAILAMAAATVGDPLAADMDAYIGQNPPKETLVVLEQAIAARAWAERTPSSDVAASVTVDGSTRTVPIPAGSAVWLTLTPAQLATTRLSPSSGSVLVTTTYEAPLDPTSIQPVSGMTFTRSTSPTGPIRSDQYVVVRYIVNLGADPDDGCYRVIDQVPSGLAPLAVQPTWPDTGDGSTPPPAPSDQEIGPWQIVGQRVEFCVTRDPQRKEFVLRYVARVVTPGTYHWEPTVLQSSTVPEQGIVLPATDLTITPAG